MGRPRKTIEEPQKTELFARTNRRKLDTPGRIASEMGKIYRAAASGSIPCDEALRLSAILREVRTAREAADAVAFIEQEHAGFGVVNILSVPPNSFIDPRTGIIATGDGVPATATPQETYAPTPAFAAQMLRIEQTSSSAVEEPLPVIGEVTDDHHDDGKIIPLRAHSRRDDDDDPIGGT